MINLSKEVICVYCGNIDKLNRFMLKYKDGRYQTKFVKCRKCSKRMRFNTVNNNMSFYEWGYWLYANIIIYSSPNYRFYDDINFEGIKESLIYLGSLAIEDFWKGFYDAKEDRNTVNKGDTYLYEELKRLNLKHGIYSKTIPKVLITSFT
jgi:hypothetical protein